MITRHRTRTAGSPPPVGSAPSADPSRSDINAASDINGIFKNDTPLGRLELHSAGESTLVDELRARESG